MSRKVWARITAVLTAVVLVAALVVPAMALAAVGGPYSESGSNPEDNGIVNIPTDGGDYDIGTSGKVSLSIPVGAVLSSKVVTVTVWSVRGGKAAEDGSVMSSIMECEPDGFIFEKPVTVSYVYPPGLSNPRAHGEMRTSMPGSASRAPSWDPARASTSRTSAATPSGTARSRHRRARRGASRCFPSPAWRSWRSRSAGAAERPRSRRIVAW